MKIIVDKMPEKPEDCLFFIRSFSNYACKYGKDCNVKECNILKPIIDFYAKSNIIEETEKDWVRSMYPLVSRKGSQM